MTNFQEIILKAMLFCSVNINRRFFRPTEQISWAGVGKGKGEISFRLLERIPGETCIFSG